MKFLFDLFPIILFFAAYKLGDIFIATGVAIAATVAQIVWVRFRHGKVDTMLWISLGVITLFGGATLLLHDETFIKWKPTIIYWLFASILLGGRLLMQRNLMKTLLGAQMELPEPVWERVNFSWIGFFTTMGVINLWVAFTFPTDTWVNFKLFGGIGLMLVFVIAQGLMLSKYIEEKP